MTRPLKISLLALNGIAATGLFFWMHSLASWRPVKAGKTSNPIGFLSEDGKIGLSFIDRGDEEVHYGDEIIDLENGRTMTWPDKDTLLGFSKTSPELAFLADGEAGKIKAREVRTGKLKQTLHWVRGIFDPYFVNTSNASTVAIVGNNTLFLWNINSGKHFIRVPLKNPFTTGDPLYALSPDGTWLIGCSWGRGTIWNAHSGQVLQSWTIKGKVRPELISSDARVFVYHSDDIDGYLFVDGSTGKVLWQKQKDPTDEGDRSYPCLVEDDEVFFSTSQQCNVFDLFTGHLNRQLTGPREADGNLVRITHDYIYTVHSSSDTPHLNGEILRWRAR